MAVFDDKTRNQLQSVLKNMVNPVKVVLFTQEFQCPVCRDTKNFAQEICSLSDKLFLEVKGFLEDGDYAVKLGADKVPAIVLIDHQGVDHGIRFFGPPGGYEINSFLKALLEVSGRLEKEAENIEKRIQALDKDVHIQVFVSLGCPHCPEAVEKAHRLALKNPHIKADMIEGSSFPHLLNKYNVSSVPKIVINDKKELLGNVPMEHIVAAIETL